MREKILKGEGVLKCEKGNKIGEINGKHKTLRYCGRGVR